MCIYIYIYSLYVITCLSFMIYVYCTLYCPFKASINFHTIKINACSNKIVSVRCKSLAFPCTCEGTILGYGLVLRYYYILSYAHKL